MQVFRRLSILLILSFCLVSLSSADAKSIIFKALSKLGSVVIAKQPAILRAAPPGGIFAQPGINMGMTSKNNSYLILEGTQVPMFFHTNRWVKVAPIDPDGAINQDEAGWVYWGADTTTSSQNFVTMKPDDIDPKIKAHIREFFKAYK